MCERERLWGRVCLCELKNELRYVYFHYLLQFLFSGLLGALCARRMSSYVVIISFLLLLSLSVHLSPSLSIYIFSYAFMRVYTIIYLCVSEREVTGRSTFYFVDNLLYFTLPVYNLIYFTLLSVSLLFYCISFFPSISFIHKPLSITEINQASNPLYVLSLA